MAHIVDDFDGAELEQIRFWVPLRVGDIVFNWFD